VGKVAKIRQKLDEIGSSAWLEVDGGISPETLPAMKAAGANVFVAATAIFKCPGGIAAGIAALREAINK
jgi:ribulose-phosphate 3-epimerase